MPLHGLNHFTICPQDLEKTRAFYVDVLGLEVGHRPPLDFPGYWLWSAGQPTVHLIGMRAQDQAKPPRAAGATGLLDHVAFTASGLGEIRARLRRAGIDFEERVLPRVHNTQLFFHDPDGVSIELNFPAHETELVPAG
jgi:catechol 2,3-dioxygenase-like lactoylglutathione lyase family enzyme